MSERREGSSAVGGCKLVEVGKALCLPVKRRAAY